MLKKYLSKSDYEKFMSIANYNAGEETQKENAVNFREKRFTPKQFCDEQIKKFEGNGNKTGCCLNFSTYLLSKYIGFILTCKDNGAMHCAFVFPMRGKDGLYVCDPAREKILENEFCIDVSQIDPDLHFAVPFGEYNFPNVNANGENEPQEYLVHIDFDSADNEGLFINKFVRGKCVSAPTTAEIDESEIWNALAKQITNE